MSDKTKSQAGTRNKRTELPKEGILDPSESVETSKNITESTKSRDEQDDAQYAVNNEDLLERIIMLSQNPLVSSGSPKHPPPRSRDRSRERRRLNKSPILPRLQARLYSNAPLRRRRTVDSPYVTSLRQHSDVLCPCVQASGGIDDNPPKDLCDCSDDIESLLVKNKELKEENDKLLAEVEKVEGEKTKLKKRTSRPEAHQPENNSKEACERSWPENLESSFTLLDTLTDDKLDFLRRDLQKLQLEGAVLKERLTHFQAT